MALTCQGLLTEEQVPVVLGVLGDIHLGRLGRLVVGLLLEGLPRLPGGLGICQAAVGRVAADALAWGRRRDLRLHVMGSAGVDPN